MLARVLTLSVILLFVLPIQLVHADDRLQRLPGRPTAQLANAERIPSLPAQRRVYITYGGNVILRFPNFSLRIVNFRDGSIPGADASGVVFRNDAGMYWDGRGLILTPNYPSHLLTKYRYARGIVGGPNELWPSLDPDTKPLEIQVIPDLPPLVGYRSLADARAEGYVGPDHGPVAQLASQPPLAKNPLLIHKPYVAPPKPHLALDGSLTYTPSETATTPSALQFTPRNW